MVQKRYLSVLIFYFRLSILLIAAVRVLMIALNFTLRMIILYSAIIYIGKLPLRLKCAFLTFRRLLIMFMSLFLIPILLMQFCRISLLIPAPIFSVMTPVKLIGNRSNIIPMPLIPMAPV
ncbi:hypothetical protein AN401_08745 [Zobellella denitrificans]|uniref:Uncharacterized protein n=1 Tax=Zobellella denitrificans TaxID=347534 RepID=A0A291HP79_9GAMM|nr:hypothetical protein AN401_08745 [Zobellella denitrificans]